MLSLYRLEVFNAVVEAGSFSRAAERLYISQAAVSQHIGALENGLGAPLFVRGRRGVALTPAGQTLHGYTRRIVRLLEEAENALTRVDQLAAGQIRIGASPGAGQYLLPEWVRRFRAQYPKLSVSMVTDVTPRIAASILGRALDIGLVEGEVDGVAGGRLASLPLREIEQYVVVGKGHAWCGRDGVSVEDIAAQPLIARPRDSQSRLWLDGMFARAGLTPHVAAEFDNPEAIKQAILSGMGIAVLPDYVVRREQTMGLLRALPVLGDGWRRALNLIWDRERLFSPVTRAFLRGLAETFPALAVLTDGAPETGRP
ncbi:MAG: LysR family transcriptional regulator [Anaerolineae bacterium]|nr:LysR family transcriptional regulator [Anaerolineae bacterium]